MPPDDPRERWRDHRVIDRSVRTTGDLFALLARSAAHTIDGVDLLSHQLRCAALLAGSHPDDLELQVAGLVHDLGVVLEPRRAEPHAAVGAGAVEWLLGPRVAALVALHEPALRHLATTEAWYRNVMGPAAHDELRVAGGLMRPEERGAFQSSCYARPALELRRADDRSRLWYDVLDDGPVSSRYEPPGLMTWRDPVQIVARTSRASRARAS